MRETTLSLHTDFTGLGPIELVVQDVRGRMAMDELFELRIHFACAIEGGLPREVLEGLLAHPARLTHDEPEGEPVEIAGIFRGIELRSLRGERGYHYEAVLVPSLWKTTQSYRTRIYQNQTVQQTVDEVLGLSGLSAQWDLRESYPEREYVVQYEETDFAFLSRQLEHWGIFYFFKHTDSGDALVISDHDGAFEAVPGFDTVDFGALTSDPESAQMIHEVRQTLERQPASLTVRDYNYRTPTIALKVDQAVDETPPGTGTHWLYGDHFKTPEEGTTIARIRSEQLLRDRERFRGLASVRNLFPGMKVSLSGHPIPELDIGYLITEVRLAAGQGGALGGPDGERAYHFEAVALDRPSPPPVPYRSRRVAPWPKIRGFMHGVIDGQADSTAAHLDDQGRYKVLLYMDSVGQAGGAASRWIRMAQPTVGEQHGMHFPLHVGTEVAILHLDGNPDRPVIVGALPNPEHVSPVTSASPTFNRLRTASGIELVINDDAD